MIPTVLTEPVDPIPTPVRPEPSPKNADAVMIPETLILVPVKFVIVPEVLFSVVNVVTPLMDIPIVDVFPVFKTVCNGGSPASPIRFDPSPK